MASHFSLGSHQHTSSIYNWRLDIQFHHAALGSCLQGFFILLECQRAHNIERNIFKENSIRKHLQEELTQRHIVEGMDGREMQLESALKLPQDPRLTALLLLVRLPPYHCNHVIPINLLL